MKNKKVLWVTRFFYTLLIVIATLIIIFIGAYLGGSIEPADLPEADWWSALGVFTTLTMAVLLLNFVRESDYEEIKKRIGSLENELDNAKQLSVLSTVVLDLTTEDSSLNSEKWNNSLDKVSELFRLNFISKDDMYRISLKAWNQGDVKSVLKIRRLIYEKEPNELRIKLNLLSILPYLQDVEGQDSYIKELFTYPEFFLKEIGLATNTQTDFQELCKSIGKDFPEVSREDLIFALGLTGRYLFAKQEYRQSEIYFQLAIKHSGLHLKRWQLRFLIMLNIAKGDFSEARKNLGIAQKIIDWQNDFRYQAFEEMIENILFIIEDKVQLKLNTFNYNQALGISHYDKFTMWDFYSILSKLNIPLNKKSDIIEAYKQFYLFFGADDRAIEKTMSNMTLNKHKENIFNQL